MVCPTLDFTEGQKTALRTVVGLGAILSIFGSAFIVFSYWFFPRLRTFPYKIIVFLSVADVFASLSYFIGLGAEIDNASVTTPADECDGFACTLSAWMTQMFDVSTFLWTSVIAFNIFEVLVREKGRRVEANERMYQVIAWGIPFINSIIVLASGAYRRWYVVLDQT